MSGLRAKPLNGRHVLLLVVGFFATISAVNAVMIWLALETHPGMVSSDPYREGLAYNRTIEARQAQLALGWQADIDVARKGPRREISARFLDRSGMPITGLTVTARLQRPAARASDATVALRYVGGGLYLGELGSTVAGRWRLELDANRRSGLEVDWHMERELWMD
jgi:nitrogen fixation protein FixH